MLSFFYPERLIFLARLIRKIKISTVLRVLSTFMKFKKCHVFITPFSLAFLSLSSCIFAEHYGAYGPDSVSHRETANLISKTAGRSWLVACELWAADRINSSCGDAPGYPSMYLTAFLTAPKYANLEHESYAATSVQDCLSTYSLTAVLATRTYLEGEPLETVSVDFLYRAAHMTGVFSTVCAGLLRPSGRLLQAGGWHSW
ncbi:MAG: hypothetical protein HS115_10915 [Spirochaetales bacterium]|nr:hypothetical protein [Spirochaetales bacterium]